METTTLDLGAVASGLVALFPRLDRSEQTLALELYRLLGAGDPVPPSLLAQRLGRPVEEVKETLGGWPGVFSTEEGAVMGFWGLSTPLFETPHRLTVGDRTLFAWCAWDTLFLPALLGREVAVESRAPGNGETIRLTVSPDRVEHLGPEGAVMSLLVPEGEGAADAVREDVVSTLCHFIHFFPSEERGRAWQAKHPETLLVTVDEAFYVGAKKNELQLGAVLER